MRASKIGVFAVLALPLTVSVVAHSRGSARMDRSRQSSPQAPAAQSAPQASAETAQPTQPASRRVYPRRQTSCWRVVGVAPTAVNQRWHIQDNAKGKIAAVCGDAFLAAEKKREKIGEINEEKEQEIAKIIPAKQLQAVKECEAERDQERPKRQGATAQNELGPCGAIIPAQAESPKHSHGNQPSKPRNQ